VIGGVAVTTGGSLDVLDCRVVGLDLSGCGAGDNQHFDLFPHVKQQRCRRWPGRSRRAGEWHLGYEERRVSLFPRL
jgi:hypothetical protein